MLPDERLYFPPVTLTVYDALSFGRFWYVGTHIQPTLARFFVKLETQEQHLAKMRFAIFPQIRQDCE
jgi:hypothetical protein